MNTEEEFSDLSPEERTVRCLELAQLALGRVEASTSEEMKGLNLNMARCWHSLARQFDTIKSLQASRAFGIPVVRAGSSELATQAGTGSEVDSFFQSFAPAGI